MYSVPRTHTLVGDHCTSSHAKESSRTYTSIYIFKNWLTHKLIASILLKTCRDSFQLPPKIGNYVLLGAEPPNRRKGFSCEIRKIIKNEKGKGSRVSVSREGQCRMVSSPPRSLLVMVHLCCAWRIMEVVVYTWTTCNVHAVHHYGEP